MTIRSSGARKRIGPDLARVGGKYSNDWHYAHLNNPQALVPESLMPHYAFLAQTPLRHRRHRGHAARQADARRAVHRRAISPTPRPTCRRRPIRQADAARLLKRYPKAVTVPGDGRAGHRNGRAGRLSAGARHDGRFRRHQRREAAAIGGRPWTSWIVMLWLLQHSIVVVVRRVRPDRGHRPTGPAAARVSSGMR